MANKKLELDYSRLKNYENPVWGDTKYILKCMNTKDVLGSIYAIIKHSGIPNWSTIKNPLLIVCGNDDPLFNTSIKNSLPASKNIELKIIPNKKHLFLKTEVIQVTEIIQSFLTKHWSDLQK